MTRDGLAEILDFEGAFKTRGEEAAKGGDEGGERGEDEDMELHGGDVEGWGEGRGEWEGIGLWREDRVGGAGKTG